MGKKKNAVRFSNVWIRLSVNFYVLRLKKKKKRKVTLEIPQKIKSLDLPLIGLVGSDRSYSYTVLLQLFSIRLVKG